MRAVRFLSAKMCRTLLRVAMLLFVANIAALLIAYPLWLCVLAVAAAYQIYRRRGGGSSGWAHGTAMWADATTLSRNGLLSDEGLILGRIGDERATRWQAIRSLFSRKIPDEIACTIFFDAMFRMRKSGQRIIRLKKFLMMATFAGVGKGKGVAALIPNLLSYNGSCVVTDPKGELYNATASHRRKKFGHRCIKFDPFNVVTGTPGTASMNSLLSISPNSPEFLDQCRALAKLLVTRTGKETDPHWADSAEIVLTALIAFVCAFETDPATRNLQTVRDILSSPLAFDNCLKVMLSTEGYGGIFPRIAGTLKRYQGKELGSVMTTANRFTEFLDSPAVQACTMGNDFDPKVLRSGRVTVYLILPPTQLESQAPLMRMWLGTILRTLTDGLPSEKNIVLFLIDEAAHLGKVKILQDAVTLMRGYGVRLWFFFQSPKQLEECYGEHASVMLDNFDTTQFFGLSGYESAEMVSKRIGDTTIGITTSSRSGGSSSTSSGGAMGSPPSSGSNSGWSDNYSEAQRRLVKPEELMTWGEDWQIIFHRNLPPIAAKLCRYYRSPEFRFGGTGRARGLGLSSHILAALAVAASLLFIAGTSNMSVARFLDGSKATQTTAAAKKAGRPVYGVHGNVLRYRRR